MILPIGPIHPGLKEPLRLKLLGRNAFTYLKESAVSVHMSIHKPLQKL